MPAADNVRIAQLGAPVLCADTCAVLDLLRSPARDDVRANDRQAAVALLAAMEGGSALVGLIADQVTFELGENLTGVQEEAKKGVKRLKEQLQRVNAVAAAYGASGTADLSHLDDYVARALAIVARWMKASRQVTQKSEITGRAFLRVNQGRTPAEKGKQAMKDCVVIETYLDVATELRAAGHSAPIVFVSSNTKDYAATTGSALKPDLEKEFDVLSMGYAPNLAAAKHMLGV